MYAPCSNALFLGPRASLNFPPRLPLMNVLWRAKFFFVFRAEEINFPRWRGAGADGDQGWEMMKKGDYRDELRFSESHRGQSREFSEFDGAPDDGKCILGLFEDLHRMTLQKDLNYRRPKEIIWVERVSIFFSPLVTVWVKTEVKTVTKRGKTLNVLNIIPLVD